MLCLPKKKSDTCSQLCHRFLCLYCLKTKYHVFALRFFHVSVAFSFTGSRWCCLQYLASPPLLSLLGARM